MRIQLFHNVIFFLFIGNLKTASGSQKRSTNTINISKDAYPRNYEQQFILIINDIMAKLVRYSEIKTKMRELENLPKSNKHKDLIKLLFEIFSVSVSSQIDPAYTKIHQNYHQLKTVEAKKNDNLYFVGKNLQKEEFDEKEFLKSHFMILDFLCRCISNDCTSAIQIIKDVYMNNKAEYLRKSNKISSKFLKNYDRLDKMIGPGKNN